MCARGSIVSIVALISAPRPKFPHFPPSSLLFSNNEIFHANGYFTLYAGRRGGLASKTRRLIKIGRTGRSIGRIYRRIFFTADFQPNIQTISRSDICAKPGNGALLLATLPSKRDRSPPTLIIFQHLPHYFIPEIK